MIVQKELGVTPEYFLAYYLDSGDGAIAVGDNVCFKHDEDLAPQAGEFDELSRFQVVTKPKTANLSLYAGVITEIVRRQGTGSNYSSFVRVQLPKPGSVAAARCNVNATAATTFLRLANDNWGLVAEATATTRTVNTVAIAGETANTSVTAGKRKTFFLS